MGGDAGFDYVAYGESAQAVWIDLAAGRGFGGDAEGDCLFGIEGIFGSERNDCLSGNAAAALSIFAVTANLLGRGRYSLLRLARYRLRAVCKSSEVFAS
jgi:hypothetical protein